MEASLYIICDHPCLSRNIQRLITHCGLDALCHMATHPPKDSDQAQCLWINKTPDIPAQSDQIFDSKIRIGQIIDKITTIKALHEQNKTLIIGPYTLHCARDLLETQNGKAIRLTDTEKRLLCVLHAQNGEALNRDALLEQVWGYRSDLETHTLETHIYRLRQKMESDPSNPALLMTTAEGYALKS